MKFKHIKSIAAALAAVCVLSTGAAATYDITYASNDTPSVIVEYNGTGISFTDALPESVNDRTMLPLRATADAIGADISYDEMSGAAILTRNGMTLAVTPDSADSAAYNKNGRIYAPVRTIASAFGLKVGYREYPWYNTLTVYLVDTDEMFAEFEDNSPNIIKLLSMEKKQYDQYLMDVTINTDSDALSTTTSLFGAVLSADRAQSRLTMSVDMQAEGVDAEMLAIIEKINNGTLECIADANTIYFKVTGMEGFSEYMPESEPLTNGVWYKYTLDSSDEMELYTGRLINGFSNNNIVFSASSMTLEDFEENMLNEYFDENGEMIEGTEGFFELQLNNYMFMDRYITISSDGAMTTVTLYFDDYEEDYYPEPVPADDETVYFKSVTVFNDGYAESMTCDMNAYGLTYHAECTITEGVPDEVWEVPTDAVDIEEVFQTGIFAL